MLGKRGRGYPVGFPDRRVIIHAVELLAGHVPHVREVACGEQQQQGSQSHEPKPDPLQGKQICFISALVLQSASLSLVFLSCVPCCLGCCHYFRGRRYLWRELAR